jgi:hypothetical protein
MVKIKLSTEFSVNTNNGVIWLNLKLVNALGNVSISYQKDNNGNYHLLPTSGTNDGIWEPLSAGLATIYRFLDHQITNETKIIIKKVVKNEIINKEMETEIIEKLDDQDIGVEFYNLSPNDVPKELRRGGIKFYLLEKILKGTSVEDIKQIGYNKLILRKIELKYIEKRRKVFDEKKGKEVLRVAGFDFDYPIFYSVDFMKKDKIRIFFQSVIEENEKVIKVLYCIGLDCETTKQRIRKINRKNKSIASRTTISYCSDWEINTTGDNEIIQGFATQVAKNLSAYLDISEQFIRAMGFNVLWDMCKTSS